MSAAISFWKRLGHLIRGNGHAQAFSPVDDSRPSDVGEPAAASGEGSAPHALAPDARRGRLPRGGGGYERVIQLMDAMRTHFDKQDRRAEELAASVERVATTLDRLAEAQQAQNQHMSSVAENVRQAREHAATLTSSLRDVPASIQAQSELARLLARHVESASQTDGQLIKSLQHFGSAAESLRDTGAAQFEALQRLYVTDQEQKQTLVTFVREQNRRFLIGALIAAALGIGTLVTLVVTLVVLLGR
ncbi:MAG TPA: hypothetical protein PKC49_07260 [Phycisphaerae bacterium]|nr:hypothetical protein [Phycisphaerae bacterium]